MKLVLAIATSLGLAIAATTPALAAEEAPEKTYTVVRQYESFEVRDYAPYVVAEVTLPGSADEAGNQGFRILAGYIFGKNKGERQIAMTTPVTQSAEPKTIAMTTPVTQAASEGGFVIQFKMPAEYTLDTLPEPLDARIKFRETPGQRFAVIRYSGRWSDSNYNEHLDLLRKGVEAAGLRSSGSPIYARYNAPFVPWFMRRNEIWLKID
ncbi:SOUL family heme-binding protein [Rhodocyclus tenuis]|uniref:SOUL family heme-binding protein n=1 Tax=Rhodocyclus tenuis TaxID=1066 RepID=UPI001906F3B7|nr:heme-binding protein [Rhodocyclus tenuis]MBK1681258.1 hypothetical protein [Rhodocyclus tenuis]